MNLDAAATNLHLPVWAMQYLVAVFGSLAVEIAALLKELRAREGKIPPRWRGWAYPSVHAAFALLGAGPLAIMFDPSTIWSALYIGITAPVILDQTSGGGALFAPKRLAETAKARPGDSDGAAGGG